MSKSPTVANNRPEVISQFQFIPPVVEALLTSALPNIAASGQAQIPTGSPLQFQNLALQSIFGPGAGFSPTGGGGISPSAPGGGGGKLGPVGTFGAPGQSLGNPGNQSAIVPNFNDATARAQQAGLSGFDALRAGARAARGGGGPGAPNLLSGFGGGGGGGKGAPTGGPSLGGGLSFSPGTSNILTDAQNLFRTGGRTGFANQNFDRAQALLQPAAGALFQDLRGDVLQDAALLGQTTSTGTVDALTRARERANAGVQSQLGNIAGGLAQGAQQGQFGLAGQGGTSGTAGIAGLLGNLGNQGIGLSQFNAQQPLNFLQALAALAGAAGQGQRSAGPSQFSQTTDFITGLLSMGF